MRNIFILNIMVLTVVSSLFTAESAYAAKTMKLPTNLFSGKAELAAPTLSLDGSRLAYIVRKQGKEIVVLRNLDTGKMQGLPIIKNEELAGLRFANHEILLVSYRSQKRHRGKDRWLTKLASYNTSKKKLKPKWLKAKYEGSTPPLNQAYIENWLPNDPKYIYRSIWDYGKSSIRKLNIYTGQEKEVEEGRKDLDYYVFDQNDALRVASGHLYREQVIRHSYKSARDGKWRVLNESKYRLGMRPFDVIAFTKDPEVAYVLDTSEHGTTGLFLMNLETKEKIKDVFSHPKFDVDGMEFTGPAGSSGMATQGKLSAVSYTNDIEERFFISKYSKKLQAIVDKSLPGTINTIISQARKTKRFIIIAHSPQDDGVYYYLDLAAGKIDPIGEARPGLNPKYLGQVERVDIPVTDGSTIPAYATFPAGVERKKLPTIILPHGGPHDRDDMYYDWLSQFMANRGYMVVRPNFRGSSGYGLDYLKKGIKQWGGLMQQDVENTTDWAIKQGYSDPERLCLMGWSYGGYAALIGAVQSPTRYKCFISINGVSNIPEMKSTDKYNFSFGKDFIKDVGLEGADDKSVSPYHQADKIVHPVLLVATKTDNRIPESQSTAMHDKLKSQGLSEMLLMDKGGHGIRDVENRTILLNKLEEFLGKHLNN